MKHQLLLAVLFVGGMTFSNLGFAQTKKAVHKQVENQEKCATSQRHEHLTKTDPNYVKLREEGENFYQQYSKNPVVNKAVVYIPVVVHVIHTGQAVGTGINISDAQIQSAINNLNAAYSNTSTSFTSYTGVNTSIQFCLAQRDPSGNPTTGIVRVNGSGVTQYSLKGICDASGGTGTDNEATVKALSKWDNTKYYNIWVVNEINDNDGGSGTQGYAYFAGAGSSVDGTIILYNAFGYDPDGSLGYNLKNYTNRNVTTIHEIGHALNLHHTFQGDGTGSTCPTDAVCGTSGDCVADTPRHKRSTSGCVADATVNACQAGTTAGDHQHNFMDYSSDACQTEFTAGQSTRMNSTLSNFTASGRGSLTTSNGCTPANNALDASISTIISPISSFCQTTFSPIVTLRNFGTTTLTSATITYNIDGGANQVYNWTGSLTTGSTENVTLNSVTTTTGAHTINVSSSAPNGGVDAYTTNDLSSTTFTITTSSSIPFLEDFEGSFPPSNWSVVSADVSAGDPWDTDPSIRQWEKRAVTQQSSGLAGNAAAINYVAYGYNTGSIDELISPSINLTSASAPNLTFQLSYKYFGASNFERLRVLVSTDCGVNYTAVYDKQYTQLANMGSGGTSWAPTLASNWRQETIDLTAYAGQVITLKFEGTNGYGNNLFIDKINVTDNCTAPAITTNPSNSTNCAGTNTSFTVANTGGGTYQWQENNGGGFVNISNGGIYSNATTATLNLTGVTAGMNSYTYRCVVTNGCGSVNSNSATLTVNSVATPTISAGGATTFCSGGSVVLTSSAASGNTWSTGATTQAITVSTAGTYTVTATASGCSATSAGTTVTVNSTPATPTISASGATTFCTGGSVTLTSSSASNNTWSTGETTQAITVSATGNYTVTVTSSGCSATSTATAVNVNAIPSIAIGTSSNPSLCGLSDGSIQITGSGTGTLSWTGTASGSSSVTLPATTSSLAAGTYNFTFTISGCTSSTVSQSLTDPAGPSTPTISASGATAFCSGGSVTLTSSSASGNTWSTGATTQSITVSTGGTYTVTVASGACTATSAGTTVTVNALPSITQGTVNNPSACGGIDGSIQVNGSGTGNLTWTGTASGSAMGTTLPVIVGSLGAGSYNFSFDNGCVSNTLSVSLSDPGAPATPTISADGPLNFCDGSNVTLTSSSATNNLWSNGATTQSITVTTSGNYFVTVTVAGCSSNSANTTVTVNSTPTISVATSTDPSSCGLSDGSIDITGLAISGTLNWTGTTSGSMSVTLPATIGSLPAGTYDIDFSDAIGCFSGTISHTLNDPSAPATPTISASGPTTFCAGGSVTLTSSSATDNVWSTGETTQSITVSTSGSYLLRIQVGACSSSTTNQIVTVNALPATPTISASGSTGICAGSSVTLTSSAASGNTWSSGETTQSITVSTAGSYSVTVSASGCSSSSSATTVTVNPVPVISMGTTTNPSSCGSATGSIQINGTATGTLSWTGTASGSTSATLPFTVGSLGAGSYTFTMDDGCVSNSVSVTLSDPGAPATPSITPAGPTTFCQGGSVALFSSSATDNVWSTGETSTSIVVTTSGTYTLSLSVAGCVSAAASVTVTVNPVPAAPVVSSSDADNVVCDGTLITLTSSEASGNTWTTGATTQSITVSATGSYTVTVTNGLCSSSTSTAITVNPNPSIGLGIVTRPSDCGFTDGSIEITGTATGVLSWAGADPGSSGTVTLPFVVTGLRSVFYDFTFVSSDGCLSNNSSTTLTDMGFLPTPTITASGSTTICGGTSVVLTSSEASGNTWSTGETTQSITVNTAGDYTVTLAIGTCTPTTSAIETITVLTSPTAPTISASGATTFCDGGTVTLTSSETSGNTWSTGETTQSIDVTTSGSYTVSFSNGTCSASSAAEVVTVNPIPATPIITPDGPSTFCAGGSVNLSSSATTGTIQWAPNGETTASIPVNAAGDYSVTVTENGCSATSAITTVVVNTNPTVTLASFANVCDTLAVFPLSGGSPAGGSYTVNTTAATNFDPGTANIGSNDIVYTFTDGNGCSGSASATITVDVCVGIEGNEQQAFVLYPNPTTSVVYLKGELLNQITAIELQDALGRKVSTLNFNTQQKSIDLSPYAAGVYTLVIKTGSNESMQKIQVLK